MGWPLHEAGAHRSPGHPGHLSFSPTGSLTGCRARATLASELCAKDERMLRPGEVGIMGPGVTTRENTPQQIWGPRWILEYPVSSSGGQATRHDAEQPGYEAPTVTDLRGLGMASVPSVGWGQ